MLEALTYQEMLRNILNNSEQYGIESDIIGILLTRPDLETGRSILTSLEYYHFRTGKSVNFYLPGYGAYWNDSYLDGKVVTEINDVKWYFSNEMFVNFIEELEKYTVWKYGGESQLLLIPYNKGQISYEKTMVFNLDKMLRDKVIFTIQEFFEKLFRLCKDKETLNEISSSLGLHKAKQIVSNRILEKIPIGLGEVFTQEKYFCVKGLKK